MKRILLLLLLATFSIQAQTLQNPTYGNVKLKNNTQSATATKVNVQENDGTINTKPLSELDNYLEFASAVNLPVTGEQGKLYLTKDNNRLYRFNGTIYQELTTDISGKENLANKQNSLAVDGTNTKYPTVTAVNAGLALKANLASPTFTGTPTAPTATAGTNTTQIANAAFVTSAINTAISTADSGNVKLTGNQTISGQKSFSLTGKIDMQTNNASPAITATTLGSNGGSAATFINSSSSPYSSALNLQTGLSGGVGNSALYVSNQSSIGTGIFSNASNGGVSISSQSGNGDSYISNITDGGTGRNYVGRNDGIETYSVDKTGNVLGNSYIKRSTPVNNILLAGGGDLAQGTAFNKNFGTTAGTVVEGGTLGSNAYNSTAYLPATSTNGINNWDGINGFRSAYENSLNMPDGRVYWSGIRVALSSNSAYGFDLVNAINSVDYFVRTTGGNVPQSWVKLWNSGNFNPANYLPLSGGTLTGIVTAPTPTAGSVGTQIATKEYVLANSGVTSTGTTNRIPKFTSSNSLGDSGLIQVGGNIGMGSAVVPGELFHIGDGNILLEGGGEVAQKFKRDFTTTGENLGVPTGSGISVNPIFQVGRIIQAGDGDPEIRIMYSDDNTSERTVFEVDRKGIAASVKTSIGSHFEGFASLTDVNPKFRLNSYPRMRLEMGAGGNDITDVAVERGATGSLDFFTNSAYRGGFDSSGNLNLLNKPTAPTATAGTNTTQIATTAFVQKNSRPYKVYTALLSQSGTNAPVATVLENTLGGTVVWSYVSIGQYRGALTGAFLSNKTVVFLTNVYGKYFLTGGRENDDSVMIGTQAQNGGSTNGDLSNSSIEIRVYL